MLQLTSRYIRLVVFGAFPASIGIGFATPLLAQKTFEGTIVYDVSLGHRQSQLVLRTRGQRVRREMVIPDAPEASKGNYQIVDYGTGDVTTVLPAMKRYLVVNRRVTRDASPESDDSAGERTQKLVNDLVSTGHKESIAGLSCEVYVIKSRPGGEWCVTTGLGHFFGFDNRTGALGMGATPFALPAPLASAFKDGAIILRMRMESPNHDTVTMVARRVDRSPPATSLFTPPADFEQVMTPTMPRP